MRPNLNASDYSDQLLVKMLMSLTLLDAGPSRKGPENWVVGSGRFRALVNPKSLERGLPGYIVVMW